MTLFQYLEERLAHLEREKKTLEQSLARQEQEFTHLSQQLNQNEYSSSAHPRHPHTDDKAKQVSASQTRDTHTRMDGKPKQVSARCFTNLRHPHFKSPKR